LSFESYWVVTIDPINHKRDILSWLITKFLVLGVENLQEIISIGTILELENVNFMLYMFRHLTDLRRDYKSSKIK